jgi:hypothetical protein
MYKALAKYAPGDPPAEKELESYGKLAAASTTSVADYEICQVIWASDAERTTKNGLSDKQVSSTPLGMGGWVFRFGAIQSHQTPPVIEGKASADSVGSTTDAPGVLRLVAEEKYIGPDGHDIVRRFEVTKDGNLYDNKHAVAKLMNGKITAPDGTVLIGVNADRTVTGTYVQNASLYGFTLAEDGTLHDSTGTTWEVSTRGEIVFREKDQAERWPFITSGYDANAKRDILLLFLWSANTEIPE